MEDLKLLETEPKKINWKKERVNLFLAEFENATGKRCPVGYPILMRLITVYSEEQWSYPSEESGEIEFAIPPMDEWEEQVKGFFKDEWASNCGYHFSYLLKQYGRFVKFTQKPIPLKTKPQIKTTRVRIHCSNCNKDHWSDERC